MKSLPHDKRPRLVFLNACSTADYNSVNTQGSLAEALVIEGLVAATIGMGYPIANNEARTFSKAFYQALLKNGQIDYAMLEGRKSLGNVYGKEYRGWITPRLYSGVPDGEIFRWK